jgi:ribonuclease HI
MHVLKSTQTADALTGVTTADGLTAVPTIFSMSKVDTFTAERARLNEVVMRHAGTGMKRFWALDHQAYQDGALPARTKELLGLVASLVLRCDDCILYHTIECHKAGVSSEQFEETMNIGLVVGGSIVIPHLRRAFEAWEELSDVPAR